MGREGAFQKYSLITEPEQMELPDKASTPGFGVCPRSGSTQDVWMLWISLNLAVFSALEISSLSEGAFRHQSLLCRGGGGENLTLSNKNVLTAFGFAETWEGFCLFSNVQQKDFSKPQNL